MFNINWVARDLLMTHVFIFFIAVCVQGLVLCIIMLIRNNLIFSYRSRALEICHKEAQQLISSEHFNDWKAAYELYDKFNYDDMMNKHLTKWRFKDFFPELVNKKSESKVSNGTE